MIANNTFEHLFAGSKIRYKADVVSWWLAETIASAVEIRADVDSFVLQTTFSGKW